MIRTQIYLTEKEQVALRDMARATGCKQSALIRMAVDKFLEQTDESRREMVLRETAGMWKDHAALPDFEAVRRTWDRG